MSPAIIGLLAMMLSPADPASAGTPAHPQVACWQAGSWTAAGEGRPGALTFDTGGDTPPERIEHDVDEIWDGDRLIQRYSFIDYHFGNGGQPLIARTYLDAEPEKVAIRFPRGQLPRDADDARRRITGDVICYLQKRFGVIDALTASGYEPIWTRN